MRGFCRFILAAGLFSCPAVAQSQSFHVTGLDGMTQTVKQEGQSAITGLAFRARVASDDLPVGMSLMPNLEYWKDSDRLQDFNIRASQKDLTLGLDARYDLTMGSWRPYFGGGLSAHFIKSKFSAPDIGVPGTEESHTKIGPNALLGLQLAPLGFLQSFIEAKYEHVPPFRQFKFNWGFGVNF